MEKNLTDKEREKTLNELVGFMKDIFPDVKPEDFRKIKQYESLSIGSVVLEIVVSNIYW